MSAPLSARLFRLGLLFGLLSLGMLGSPAPASTQDVRELTLEEARRLAVEGNAAIALSRYRVEEAERRARVAYSNYLPRVDLRAGYLLSNNTQGILLPAGSLGNYPELGGAFPPVDQTVPQGGQDLLYGLTTVAQPLTQIFQIRAGRGVALGEEAEARAGLARVEQTVLVGVLRAYGGLLLAQEAEAVARERVAVREAQAQDVAVAVRAGRATEVAEREARVRLLQARQELLEREGEVEDVHHGLVEALGLAPGTNLRLEPPTFPSPVAQPPLEELVDHALRSHPAVLESEALMAQANSGLRAARAAYIPQVGLMGMHLYQNSVPFFPRHTLAVGIQASWTILDFGARRNSVAERQAQVGQAEEGARRTEGEVRGQVEAAYRKVERTATMLELAQEAMELRAEGARLGGVQTEAGMGGRASELEARLGLREAELDLLGAQVAYAISLEELRQATGRLRPQITQEEAGPWR